MAISVHLFKPRGECAWMMDLPYIDLTDQTEKIMTVPDSVEVRAVRAKACFCSNDTHGGPGMFMGISDCDINMMEFAYQKGRKPNEKSYEVTFRVPGQRSRVLSVISQAIPGNVTMTM